MGKLKVRKVPITHDEKEFVLRDGRKENARFVTVHPWIRNGIGEVYIEIEEAGVFLNAIVSRKKLTKGLLATFDELQLKEDKK